MANGQIDIVAYGDGISFRITGELGFYVVEINRGGDVMHGAEEDWQYEDLRSALFHAESEVGISLPWVSSGT